jgi:DNA-directed RNA polymerase subunit RPC12/RpoP
VDETKDNPPAEGEGDGTLARLKAVRRAGGNVFGDTPILPPEVLAPKGDEEEPDVDAEGSAVLEPRVRNAALIAAIRTGALACAAAVFMGFVLVCSLGGLLPGGYTLGLGLFVALIGVPVSIVGAVSTYRQTLETERHKVGLCPRCGYDLRGSMGMRCPECGWRITAPGSSKSHLTDEEQRQQDMMS